MKVALITATKNRHTQLERVVRFALDQTYDNYVHIIYNNSISDLRLNGNLPKDKFLLINKFLSKRTSKPYETLGDIYNDILSFIPKDVDVLNFMDDDDIFLPLHIEEGVKGLIKGQKLAYKPKQSWYKHGINKPVLAENILEPSIFVKKEHIEKYGFSIETSAQHLNWINPLLKENQIYVDSQGLPTYICDWSQEIPTFKTSGNSKDPDNFKNYEKWSKDIGDGIITPCSKTLAQKYYNYIEYETNIK